MWRGRYPLPVSHGILGGCIFVSIIPDGVTSSLSTRKEEPGPPGRSPRAETPQEAHPSELRKEWTALGVYETRVAELENIDGGGKGDVFRTLGLTETRVRGLLVSDRGRVVLVADGSDPTVAPWDVVPSHPDPTLKRDTRMRSSTSSDPL